MTNSIAYLFPREQADLFFFFPLNEYTAEISAHLGESHYIAKFCFVSFSTKSLFTVKRSSQAPALFHTLLSSGACCKCYVSP